MYELNAHDRAVISCWNVDGGHSIRVCPEHGVIVFKTGSQVPCYCGDWGEELEAVDMPEKRKKRRKKPKNGGKEG